MEGGVGLVVQISCNVFVAVKRAPWDLSGRNVGLQSIPIAFDISPIIRYVFICLWHSWVASCSLQCTVI